MISSKNSRHYEAGVHDSMTETDNRHSTADAHFPEEARSFSDALIIGRVDGMELAVQALLKQCRRVRVVPAFSELPEEALCPDLVLALEHWPDEYSADEVTQLLHRFPLARIVCCYGPWSASGGRSRQIWPPALRVPLAETPARLDAELAVILGERAPLERTAGLDELFNFEHGQATHKA